MLGVGDWIVMGVERVESVSSNILLRTVHPMDSYYVKSGWTSEYWSIGVPEFQTCCKKGERDDVASAYVLCPL